jgi:hypothetical protein
VISSARRRINCTDIEGIFNEEISVCVIGGELAIPE